MEKEIDFDYIHISKDLNTFFEKSYLKQKKEIKKHIKKLLEEHGYTIEFRN
tara:strand:+ start:1074 stop:1226 length:153 start_codon:yes stop_codon:yes gene_type:complete